MQKSDPSTTPKQKIQKKFGKAVVDKSTSMSNKLQNTLLDNTNTYSTPDT